MILLKLLNTNKSVLKTVEKVNQIYDAINQKDNKLFKTYMD